MSLPTTTTLASAAERIRTAHVIAIVIPEHLDMTLLGSAHALAESLRGLGKSATLFLPQSPSENIEFPWRIGEGEDEPLREFIISFDLSKSPIKELRYEKAENRLDIILSPTGSRIRREDVDFRYGPLRYDLVLTIGVSSLEEAEASIRHVPELLHEKPILNIDVRQNNKRFGEFNLIPEPANEFPSIPELIYELLRSLGSEITSSETATALLASLVASTQNFHPMKTNAKTLRIAAELAEKGASMASVHESMRLASGAGDTLMQLVGRALARSRFDEKERTLFATLTRDDFLKTNAEGRDARNVLERVLAIRSEASIGVLVFQNGESDGIRTCIAFSDQVLADRFRSRLGPGTEPDISLPVSYASFPEAEEAVRRLLGDLNGVE